jgi:N-acetylglucosaminyl-diphospho-decaprenol L-rhamnosyltransferase
MTAPSQAPPACTIVIVNYNAGEHLACCLASLAPALADWNWHAIVVDNASQDGSERHALAAGDRVRLLPSDTNVGFGAAVNHGVADTHDPLILLLNPDAELAPGVVTALARELDRFPECAIIGPGILNEDGTVQGSARGDPTLLTGLFGRTTRLTRLFPTSAVARRNIISPADVPAGQQSVEVDWVSGACMLLRRDAFDEAGGFDTGFFLYWEDADLCRRLRNRGRTIRYFPAAHVRHAVGVSSKTARPASIRAFLASALRYYTKHVARNAPERWLAAALLRTRAFLKQWRDS